MIFLIFSCWIVGVAEGMPSEEMEQQSSSLIVENDLLIVGPGVLGRLVAGEWKKVTPALFI